MAYRLDSPNIVEIHGKKYYDSKKPCRKGGHIGLHFISGMCVECSKTRGHKEHQANYKKSKRVIISNSPEYWIEKAKKDSEYKKKWHENNKKRLLKQSKINNKKYRKFTPYLSLISHAKQRAIKRGLEFNLTKEWAILKWTGKCELTGIKFKYFEKDEVGYFYSASLDRIDNNKGYLQNNCRFILYAINIMKGKATDKEIFLLAKSLVAAQNL